jgi:hypothetical protein
MGLASTPLGLPRQQQRSRANASRGATLLSLPLQPVRQSRERHCPIRIISVQLLDAAGPLLRVLFLDREGHISSSRTTCPARGPWYWNPACGHFRWQAVHPMQ